MRPIALVLAVLTVSCNAVLSIPERELAAAGDGAITESSQVSLDAENLDGAIDSTTIDSGSAETAPDTDVPDTTVPDTTAPDTAMPDTAMPDTASPDTGVVDTAMPDTASPDTTVADTAVPDTAMPDVGTDTPSCGVAGTPCCGGIPASCNTNAVCNSAKMCVAATGACVRSTDCSGSACGGPTACGSNICYACTPTFGARAFGAACGSGSECSSGVCDGFRGVCSGACSNGITADADCTVYGPKVVCSELTYSTGSVSGKVGFCAQGCERDGDCAAGKHCRLTSNDDAKRVDLSCTPQVGGVPYGSACTSGADCHNAQCLTFGATKLCTPFCATSADCPATSAWRNCANVNYSKPGGGTQPVKACVP